MWMVTVQRWCICFECLRAIVIWWFAFPFFDCSCPRCSSLICPVQLARIFFHIPPSPLMPFRKLPTLMASLAGGDVFESVAWYISVCCSLLNMTNSSYCPGFAPFSKLPQQKIQVTLSAHMMWISLQAFHHIQEATCSALLGQLLPPAIPWIHHRFSSRIQVYRRIRSGPSFTIHFGRVSIRE